MAHTIPFTRRIPLVQEFTPTQDEIHLRELVAETARELRVLADQPSQLAQRAHIFLQQPLFRLLQSLL